MSRVILITDIQTPLGEELVKQFREKGFRVAALHTAGEKDLPVSDNEDLLFINWSRRSALSAKNVVLQTLNAFDRIDDTLLLETPGFKRILLQENSLSQIERSVDDWIKGSLFLIKEILTLYATQNNGLLTLISSFKEGVHPPLEGAVRGSFQALSESLFDSSVSKNIVINGFKSSSQQYREFAEYIATTLDEQGRKRSGKWFHYKPKLSLLRCQLNKFDKRH